MLILQLYITFMMGLWHADIFNKIVNELINKVLLAKISYTRIRNKKLNGERVSLSNSNNKFAYHS